MNYVFRKMMCVVLLVCNVVADDDEDLHEYGAMRYVPVVFLDYLCIYKVKGYIMMVMTIVVLMCSMNSHRENLETYIKIMYTLKHTLVFLYLYRVSTIAVISICILCYCVFNKI